MERHLHLNLIYFPMRKLTSKTKTNNEYSHVVIVCLIEFPRIKV